MKKAFDYTPGPWGATEDAPIIIHGGDLRGIAHVIGKTMGEAETKKAIANARLIAAAPQMLEALQGLIKLIDDGWLIRNTEEDHKPGFAMRQLEPYQKISNAVFAIEKATAAKKQQP